jgi:glycosyltransferase involved in cell wall biosynthesis
VAELINAMALVQGVSERLLRIVGPAREPEYLDWCRTLARTLMDEEQALRIEFELEPEAEMLEKAYAEATLVAVPTLWPESFQIDVLEAMERGLPVVGFDVGRMDVVVRDGVTGLLVPPGDVGALAATLERLLVDRDEARRMGGAARLLAEWEFHARDHVSALDRIFEQLLYPDPEAFLSDQAQSS